MNTINFSECLKELMTENNLNKLSLSQNSAIPASMLSRFLKYPISPSLTTLIKLCDYFKCTVDFIVGLTDFNDYSKIKNELNFAKKLDFIISDKKLSCYKIAKDIKISDSQFSKWRKGAIPTLVNLLKLSEYFNCTIEYLIGREN
jgi:transcriptional regulator with XRE-family HTH domain